MKLGRRKVLGYLFAGFSALTFEKALAATKAEPPIKITIYKDPTCGCCTAWARHLEAHGFSPTLIDHEDLAAMKQELGVPVALESCHTAKVGNYVVEGHVPAQDILRLLSEQPPARGLSVPGMPVGSPGMDMPGQPADHFVVVLFTSHGSQEVFASYN